MKFFSVVYFRIHVIIEGNGILFDQQISTVILIHENKSAPLDNISIHYFSSFLQPIEESGWNTLRKKGETHNIYLSHLLLLGVAKYFMHTSEVTYALWRKVINSLGSIWKKNQFQVFLTFIRCSDYFSRYELRT